MSKIPLEHNAFAWKRTIMIVRSATHNDRYRLKLLLQSPVMKTTLDLIACMVLVGQLQTVIAVSNDVECHLVTP